MATCSSLPHFAHFSTANEACRALLGQMTWGNVMIYSKSPPPLYSSAPSTILGSGYVRSARACWLSETTPGISCVSGSSHESWKCTCGGQPPGAAIEQLGTQISLRHMRVVWAQHTFEMPLYSCPLNANHTQITHKWKASPFSCSSPSQPSSSPLKMVSPTRLPSMLAALRWPCSAHHWVG